MGCNFSCSISSNTLQVNGLPTNRDFLRRIARHPSFVNADLDTSFIEKHKDSLLAPQAMPREVAALAAVANHLLDVQQVNVAQDCSFNSNFGHDTLHETALPCAAMYCMLCCTSSPAETQHVVGSQAWFCPGQAAVLILWVRQDSLGTLRANYISGHPGSECRYVSLFGYTLIHMLLHALLPPNT